MGMTPAASQKMTSHKEADHQVEELKIRWMKAHETTKEWVARMTTLVECWNKLDGNVGELSSWVQEKDSSAPEGNKELSIEKLENQLNTLKTMFAEKQQLVSDLEAFGPGGATAAATSGEGAPANANENEENDNANKESRSCASAGKLIC